MFEPIELTEAAAEQWDVILAGSSFSSMFFLRGLPTDLRVLVIEKGGIVSHPDQLVGASRNREDFAMDNTSGHRKTWVAHSLFGGNSNCWWGQVPRFHASDFELFETHGIGAPWPLRYTDLEPFYTEVEEVMEVAGGGTDGLFQRQRPYPFAAHALSRSDAACVSARPDIWVPVATARASGGSRPTCCANGVCGLCPIDSKFTVLNGVDAFQRTRVRLLVGAEVRSVDIERASATGVVVRTDGARETRIAADLVGLGTNAIFNAAILLRSGVQAEALGGYLHEQASRSVLLDITHKGFFGGSSITAHCYGAYMGDHRGTSAAVLIESVNTPNGLRTEKGRWTDRMNLKLIAEDLPSAENRVRLDARGEPRISWVGHSGYAFAGLDRAEAQLADFVPFEVERMDPQPLSVTEAHIQGTHRMGPDPATSVVDADCRVHGVAGLHALGAGVFPTSTPANPTLTLSAISLRAGRRIQ